MAKRKSSGKTPSAKKQNRRQAQKDPEPVENVELRPTTTAGKLSTEASCLFTEGDTQNYDILNWVRISNTTASLFQSLWFIAYDPRS